jgi:hypothetical protein
VTLHLAVAIAIAIKYSVGHHKSNASCNMTPNLALKTLQLHYPISSPITPRTAIGPKPFLGLCHCSTRINTPPKLFNIY